MRNLEKIVEYRTTLNNINSLIIKYTNWVINFDLTELNEIKTEYKNNLNLINLHLKLSNTTSFLQELKTRANTLIANCTKDLNVFISKVKITEYNKFTKLLLADLDIVKNTSKTSFEELQSDIENINLCLVEMLNIENYISEFKQNYDTILKDIDKKIDLLTNDKSIDLKNSLEQDRANIMLKINNFKTILQNFDEEILTTLSTNKKLSKILNDADIYVIKHNVKSNLNPLEYDEYLNLKNEFYKVLNENNDYINVQAITISNDISNFLNIDATNFNSKWSDVATNKTTDVLPKDLKHMQKLIKHTNAEIDNLSKEYGKFVDNIYLDYAKHLTEINFKLLNK